MRERKSQCYKQNQMNSIISEPNYAAQRENFETKTLL